MKHKCSNCGTVFEFPYEKGGKLPPHFPFCSHRCKTIDLGKWFNEEYRLTTLLPEAEFMTEDERQILAQFLLDEGEVDDIIVEEES